MNDGWRALRDYLDDLRRRTAEGDELVRLDAEIVSTADPMARMKRIDERRRAAERRRDLEAAFVAQARPWSQSANVRRAAFLAEGVPSDLLDRAGVAD